MFNKFHHTDPHFKGLYAFLEAWAQMKKIIKKIGYILALLPCIILLACSSTNTSPVDFIIPTLVPLGMEQVLDHDVPNIKGFTVLGVLKGAKQEMMIKMKIDAALYNIAMEQSNLFIQAGDGAANNVLGLLAAAGLGAGPLGFLAGARRKRQGDLSPEEVELKIKEAKLDDKSA